MQQIQNMYICTKYFFCLEMGSMYAARTDGSDVEVMVLFVISIFVIFGNGMFMATVIFTKQLQKWGDIVLLILSRMLLTLTLYEEFFVIMRFCVVTDFGYGFSCFLWTLLTKFRYLEMDTICVFSQMTTQGFAITSVNTMAGIAYLRFYSLKTAVDMGKVCFCLFYLSLYTV